QRLLYRVSERLLFPAHRREVDEAGSEVTDIRGEIQHGCAFVVRRDGDTLPVPACSFEPTGTGGKKRGSAVDAVLAEQFVERELVVLLPLLQALEHEQAGQAEVAAREALHPVGGHAHRPGRSFTALELFTGLGVEHAGRGSEDRARAELGAAAP